MPEKFTLDLKFKDEQYEFTVTIIRLLSAYQLQMELNNQKLVFEPDESREYKLTKMPWQNENDFKQIDSQLVEAIIEKLNTMHR